MSTDRRRLASSTEFDTRRAASSRGWSHRPWRPGMAPPIPRHPAWDRVRARYAQGRRHRPAVELRW